ncbi:unnamed protein product [Amoebophrya sp. A120]|nr:unnamed protein product [Amoebophrya sp. A120]|eukprot:GSA120T00011408001.1
MENVLSVAAGDKSATVFSSEELRDFLRVVRKKDGLVSLRGSVLMEKIILPSSLEPQTADESSSSFRVTVDPTSAKHWQLQLLRFPTSSGSRAADVHTSHTLGTRFAQNLKIVMDRLDEEETGRGGEMRRQRERRRNYVRQSLQKFVLDNAKLTTETVPSFLYFDRNTMPVSPLAAMPITVPQFLKLRTECVPQTDEDRALLQLACRVAEKLAAKERMRRYVRNEKAFMAPASASATTVMSPDSPASPAGMNGSSSFPMLNTRQQESDAIAFPDFDEVSSEEGDRWFEAEVNKPVEVPAEKLAKFVEDGTTNNYVAQVRLKLEMAARILAQEIVLRGEYPLVMEPLVEDLRLFEHVEHRVAEMEMTTVPLERAIAAQSLPDLEKAIGTFPPPKKTQLRSSLPAGTLELLAKAESLRNSLALKRKLRGPAGKTPEDDKKSKSPGKIKINKQQVIQGSSSSPTKLPPSFIPVFAGAGPDQASGLQPFEELDKKSLQQLRNEHTRYRSSEFDISSRVENSRELAASGVRDAPFEENEFLTELQNDELLPILGSSSLAASPVSPKVAKARIADFFHQRDADALEDLRNNKNFSIESRVEAEHLSAVLTATSRALKVKYVKDIASQDEILLEKTKAEKNVAPEVVAFCDRGLRHIFAIKKREETSQKLKDFGAVRKLYQARSLELAGTTSKLGAAGMSASSSTSRSRPPNTSNERADAFTKLENEKLQDLRTYLRDLRRTLNRNSASGSNLAAMGGGTTSAGSPAGGTPFSPIEGTASLQRSVSSSAGSEKSLEEEKTVRQAEQALLQKVIDTEAQLASYAKHTLSLTAILQDVRDKSKTNDAKELEKILHRLERQVVLCNETRFFRSDSENFDLPEVAEGPKVATRPGLKGKMMNKGPRDVDVPSTGALAGPGELQIDEDERMFSLDQENASDGENENSSKAPSPGEVMDLMSSMNLLDTARSSPIGAESKKLQEGQHQAMLEEDLFRSGSSNTTSNFENLHGHLLSPQSEEAWGVLEQTDHPLLLEAKDAVVLLRQKINFVSLMLRGDSARVQALVDQIEENANNEANRDAGAKKTSVAASSPADKHTLSSQSSLAIGLAVEDMERAKSFLEKEKVAKQTKNLDQQVMRRLENAMATQDASLVTALIASQKLKPVDLLVANNFLRKHEESCAHLLSSVEATKRELDLQNGNIVSREVLLKHARALGEYRKMAAQLGLEDGGALHAVNHEHGSSPENSEVDALLGIPPSDQRVPVFAEGKVKLATLLDACELSIAELEQERLEAAAAAEEQQRFAAMAKSDEEDAAVPPPDAVDAGGPPAAPSAAEQLQHSSRASAPAVAPFEKADVSADTEEEQARLQGPPIGPSGSSPGMGGSLVSDGSLFDLSPVAQASARAARAASVGAKQEVLVGSTSATTQDVVDKPEIEVAVSPPKPTTPASVGRDFIAADKDLPGGPRPRDVIADDLGLTDSPDSPPHDLEAVPYQAVEDQDQEPLSSPRSTLEQVILFLAQRDPNDRAGLEAATRKYESLPRSMQVLDADLERIKKESISITPRWKVGGNKGLLGPRGAAMTVGGARGVVPSAADAQEMQVQDVVLGAGVKKPEGGPSAEVEAADQASSSSSSATTSEEENQQQQSSQSDEAGGGRPSGGQPSATAEQTSSSSAADGESIAASEVWAKNNSKANAIENKVEKENNGMSKISADETTSRQDINTPGAAFPSSPTEHVPLLRSPGEQNAAAREVRVDEEDSASFSSPDASSPGRDDAAAASPAGAPRGGVVEVTAAEVLPASQEEIAAATERDKQAAVDVLQQSIPSMGGRSFSHASSVVRADAEDARILNGVQGEDKQAVGSVLASLRDSCKQQDPDQLRKSLQTMQSLPEAVLTEIPEDRKTNYKKKLRRFEAVESLRYSMQQENVHIIALQTAILMAERTAVEKEELDKAKKVLELAKAVKDENSANIRKCLDKGPCSNPHLIAQAEAVLARVPTPAPSPQGTEQATARPATTAAEVAPPTVDADQEENLASASEDAEQTETLEDNTPISQANEAGEHLVWECPTCSFHNLHLLATCDMCGQRRPFGTELRRANLGLAEEWSGAQEQEQQQDHRGAARARSPVPPPQHLICPMCGTRNPPTVDNCQACTFSLAEQRAALHAQQVASSSSARPPQPPQQIRGPGGGSYPVMARPVPGHEPPPFRPHQTVVAKMKMKWNKRLTQMNPKQTGSAFKVERGNTGIVVSLHPLRVRWELGGGKVSPPGLVSVEQVEDAATSEITQLMSTPAPKRKSLLAKLFASAK